MYFCEWVYLKMGELPNFIESALKLEGQLILIFLDGYYAFVFISAGLSFSMYHSFYYVSILFLLLDYLRYLIFFPPVICSFQILLLCLCVILKILKIYFNFIFV